MNNQKSNWRRQQCQHEPLPDVIRDRGQDHHVTLVVIHDQDLDLDLHIKVEEAEVEVVVMAAVELVHHGADEANTAVLPCRIVDAMLEVVMLPKARIALESLD